MFGYRNKSCNKRKAVKGFSLLELAITIAVVSLIAVITVGWQVDQFKESRAKEIATTLLAIDVAFYQVDTIIKNVNASYNVPINNSWTTTTSTTFDSYVCPLRNTASWRNRSEYSGVSTVLVDNYLDPRINLFRLARDGVTFTFIRSGGKITGIRVNGIDADVNRMVKALLDAKYNETTRTYQLNNGNGYPYSSVSYSCS